LSISTPFFLKTSNATTFGTIPFGLCGFDISGAAIYNIKGLTPFDFVSFHSRILYNTQLFEIEGVMAE
jgi:hypothetical protein